MTKTKASPTKSRASANKITKAPTRASTRIAKNMALKMEKNTRPAAPKKNTRAARSPRSPIKSPNRNVEKVINQMKQESEITNRVFELNESLRDNPRTSRNNQNTFTFSKTQFDSCKCQMQFEELNIDLYPSAVRAIENSENDLAIKALHNIEKLQSFRHYYY